MKPFFLLFLAVGLLLGGCTTPIGTEVASPHRAYWNLHRNALNSSHLSRDTRAVLHRHDLESAFRRDPAATLAQLHARALKDTRRDLLFALAELSYTQADRLRRSVKPGEPRRAPDQYLAAAIYAHLYLFANGHLGMEEFFRQRFRMACDLYNRSLALALMPPTAPRATVRLESGPRHPAPGPVDITVDASALPWPTRRVERFLSADDLIVHGLPNRNRDSGLGAPLIAVTRSEAEEESWTRHAPVTALLHIHGGLRDWEDEPLPLTLELFSTHKTREALIAGQSVPIQSDTTAPLAHALNSTLLWHLGRIQFFDPERYIKTGIRLNEPYTPGRIPVVFVHGTASSPVQWAKMWNSLNADPVVRARFQFWTFTYSSGNPVAYSAWRLRQAILDTQARLDPAGSDAALQEMVVVGHSQGGLLAKLTAVNTDDTLWYALSDKPLAATDLSPAKRSFARRLLFMEPLPSVQRVVFIATPHRGSYQATSLARQLLNLFIQLPSDLVNLYADLLHPGEKRNLPGFIQRDVPTSLDSMTPGNAWLEALAEIPLREGIRSHSIIAIHGNATPPEGRDGLVTYRSAHLEGVESEFIVRSLHSCLTHPATIEEVRRILLEHLDD